MEKSTYTRPPGGPPYVVLAYPKTPYNVKYGSRRYGQDVP